MVINGKQLIFIISLPVCLMALRNAFQNMFSK